MKQLKALLIKEIKEAFRDKRALATAMMMALMAPIMIFAMSKVMIKEAVETPPIYIKITGAEYAPQLMQKLEEKNIFDFAEVPADEKRLWEERDIQLEIPETFNQQMLDGEPIEIVLRTDYSEKGIGSPLRRVKKQIEDYSRGIGIQRVIFRGIDIKLLQPIKLVEQDTALPSSNAKMVSVMLGLYLLMAAFMSGLSVAIDTSAGERERNVLEMLLCQPVDTSKIILAKLFNASIISIIGVVLTLALTTFAVGFVDLSKIGATFNLDIATIVALLLLLLPICFFASALQLFVAFQSKSFKEAQSTVSMVIMLPAMLPVALMFIDDKPQWLDWMPITGQSLVMDDLFKGVAVNWAAVGFTGLVTIAITGALVYAMAAKLKSEKVILGLS